MDGDQWIGKLPLRTTINAQYLHAGEHIGYEIRPSKRRCGYGTALLRLGLDKAHEWGLHQVVLTCDETNTGSRKIIEANGGIWKMPWWWRDKPSVNCATGSIWMRSLRLSMQPTPNLAGCALVS